MGEFDLIARLLARAGQSRSDVTVGPGDDAAVLAVPAGRELVATTDTLVEGVHFTAGTDACDLGWKALAVNLSDLAAMGATPAWVLLSLTLPMADSNFVEDFADGFAELASPFKLALVGGDTTRGPRAISISAFGLVPQGEQMLRSGARAGDLVYVTGEIGDAAGGLRCLAADDPCAGRLMELPQGLREQLIARLRRPVPRVAAGLALRGTARACIDVSDGLLADLGHICRASGLGAALEVDAVPRSQALRTAFGDRESCELALAGGDDYELCYTIAADRAEAMARDLSRLGVGATRIGRMVAGSDVTDADGEPIRLPRAGYQHFAT